jgi:bacteriocin-like protein
MEKFKELSIEEMQEVDGGTVLTGIGITYTVRSVASGLWEIAKWPYETLAGWYEYGKDSVQCDCK